MVALVGVSVLGLDDDWDPQAWGVARSHMCVDVFLVLRCLLAQNVWLGLVCEHMS